MAMASCENKELFWASEPHALIPYTGKPEEVARCIHDEYQYRTGEPSHGSVRDGLYRVDGGNEHYDLFPWGVILRLDGVAEVRGSEVVFTGEKLWEDVPPIVKFCANK